MKPVRISLIDNKSNVKFFAARNIRLRSKMYFVINYMSFVALLTSVALLLPIGDTRNLSGRARFVQENPPGHEVFVGPVNPSPVCDRIYGKPPYHDCGIIGLTILAAAGLQPYHGTPLNNPGATVMREFYQRGTRPRYNNHALAIDLPIFWQIVRLDIVKGPSRETSDLATWRDVYAAVDSIQDICLDQVPSRASGGYQIYGEANGVALYLYDDDSIYFDQELTDSSCSDTPSVVAGGLACQKDNTHRPQPDPSTTDDADSAQQHPAQQPEGCSATARQYYSADRACCESVKGYVWISTAISKAVEGVLFGINELLEQGGIGFCGVVGGGS
ncbi:MAG: hypothetical protein M1835_000133 [Candelina submexicana]|nr:MAG: hypothetical protein M1835_000133 [Candelina submexicana]